MWTGQVKPELFSRYSNSDNDGFDGLFILAAVLVARLKASLPLQTLS